MSVRGAIWNFVSEHAPRFTGRLIEVGSKLPHPSAHFANFRPLFEHVAEYVGVDLTFGDNVDEVANFEEDTMVLPRLGTFNGAVCCEVLEHVYKPWLVLEHIHDVMYTGSPLILTVPFCFHIHDYPSDYWRFTPECLKRLLGDAGFTVETMGSVGGFALSLNNAGEPGWTTVTAPRHIFCLAWSA